MIGARARFPYALFGLLMLLDVAAQLVEKKAALVVEGHGWAMVAGFARQPWVWGVIAIKLGQLWVWTAILRRVAISLAFPLTALQYPLTMLAAMALFGERLGWRVWAGGLLITLGAAVMGPGGAGGHASETDRPAGGP